MLEIDKSVLLQRISACPDTMISELKMHYWLVAYGKAKEEENTEETLDKTE